MDPFTLFWEDHGSFLPQTNRKVTDDSFLLTGPQQCQDFGISDVLDELLTYLDSRGETTTESLPSRDEFEALAEEYGASV